VISTKTETKTYTSKNRSVNNNTLYIRGDVLPVPNYDMLMLLKSSADDMLVTGDQSITDALSCCPKKNLWYQIAPWKADYANELAHLLPNRFYKDKKTSCGTIHGIALRSDYREFVKKWDFRRIAKPRLSKIMNFAICRKYNKNCLSV
jgi:hypothetical protein